MNKRMYNLHKQKINLEENEVHIWNFDLNTVIPMKDQFQKILSDDELIRADKFHFEIDKNRFICSRGLLRKLLSIYTGISAKEISFEFNNYGKPSLFGNQNNTGLHFNLSHSKSYMSVGFAKNALIGVDVELMKPLKDHIEIAKRFFSDPEVEQLNSFPTDKILDGFYYCWTAKEAVIKLSGEGLSYPLKDFDVKLKELSVGESNRFKVNLKNRSENLFVEVFRIQSDLFGACAMNKENLDIFHCSFEQAENLFEYLFNEH